MKLEQKNILVTSSYNYEPKEPFSEMARKERQEVLRKVYDVPELKALALSFFPKYLNNQYGHEVVVKKNISERNAQKAELPEKKLSSKL